MEYKEIKNMSLEQLNKKALELKKNLFELRMKNTVGQLNNPIEIRDTRKTVARVLTAINSQRTAVVAKPAKTVKAKATKAKKTTKTKKK